MTRGISIYLKTYGKIISLDFTGDVDFSSGDYMDREVKAIYSIDSPHLVEQINVTFAHLIVSGNKKPSP